MKTLDEWIDIYEAKTKERVDIVPPFLFYYNPEHGFCQYAVLGEFLFIRQTCGNLDYWLNIALDACKEFGFKSVSSYVCRKARPYIRRLGFRIVSGENIGGRVVFKAIHKKTGERFMAESFGDGYIFTWEVD